MTDLSQIPTHALELWQARQLNNQLMSDTLGTFGGAAGVGAAAAGGVGLYNMLRHNMSPPHSAMQNLTFSVPTHNAPEEKYGCDFKIEQADVDRFHTNLKKALGQDEAHQVEGHNFFTRDELMNYGKEKKAFLGQEFLSGVGAQNISEHPLAGAAELTAAGTGLYGGYKLIDHLLANRRKQELGTDLDTAQQEYESSLQNLIQPPKMAAEKAATLDEKLDQLYEYTKEAGVMGQIANAGLTAWPPLALLGGVAGYNIMKSQNSGRLLSKAIRQRQTEQLAKTPMYAFPDYRPAHEATPDMPALSADDNAAIEGAPEKPQTIPMF